MLVHRVAGAKRADRIVVLFSLAIVTIAISAQTIHFHSPAEAASPTHCVLCEAAGAPLPVQIVVVVADESLALMLESEALPGAEQPAEGSNLSVRPPPARCKPA